MDRSTAKQDREAKWVSYLKSPKGENLLQLIVAREPSWKNVNQTAAQISTMYKFNSFAYLSSANRMHADPTASPSLQMNRLKVNAKMLGISVVIAEHIGFKVELGTNFEQFRDEK